MLVAEASAATPALKSEEQALINFGFATQLGSGIYTLSGRTLQVYNMPFGYTLPAEPQSRLRVRLTLPVTIGLVDFKPIDVVDNGLPEHLDSLAIVPGVELSFAVAANWWLEPFVEAGVARDRTNELEQRVYSAGLRSRYQLSVGATQWELKQELLRVRVDNVNTDDSDDCTRLRVGATARRAFGNGYANFHPDYLVYGVVELYTDSPAQPAEGEDDDGDGAAYEFGVTFGTVEPMRIWGLPLPRVGLGYRFGDDLSVFRVVFGTPF